MLPQQTQRRSVQRAARHPGEHLRMIAAHPCRSDVSTRGRLTQPEPLHRRRPQARHPHNRRTNCWSSTRFAIPDRVPRSPTQSHAPAREREAHELVHTRSRPPLPPSLDISSATAQNRLRHPRALDVPTLLRALSSRQRSPTNRSLSTLSVLAHSLEPRPWRALGQSEARSASRFGIRRGGARANIFLRDEG